MTKITAASQIPKRRLPHFFISGATVFVTWNLAFSFPKHIIDRLKQQRIEFMEQNKNLYGDYLKLQEYQQHLKLFDLTDMLIGADETLPRYLSEPRFAQIVADTLHFLDGKRYNLHCYCIMPNHVHVLFTPHLTEELSKITYSIKRFSANKINELQGKKGQVWHKESFDHLVRSREKMAKTLDYIMQNPVKAKLVNDWKEWKFTWVSEDMYVE